MSEANGKLFSVGVILGGMIFCTIISSLIYFCSMFVVYAAWHCPSGNCQTPTWINILVLLLLTSPLPVFGIGAYLCRNAIYALTRSWFLRVIMLLSFALFPLFLLIGLIAYIINSPK